MPKKGEFKIPDLVGKVFSNWIVLNYVKTIKTTTKRNTTTYNRIWLCRCKCGVEKEVRQAGLASGKSKSCGSCGFYVYKKLPNFIAIKRKLFSQYKRHAIRRNYSFNITLNRFSEIIEQNCYYCGIEPYQKMQSYKTDEGFKYNGIDRVNNNEGYEENNIVTCCGTCNRMKSSLSFEDFIKIIKRIYNNIRL